MMPNPRRAENRLCAPAVLAVSALLLSGCAGVTGLPEDSSTLGSLIDTLFPDQSSTDNDAPSNDPPDDTVVDASDPPDNTGNIDDDIPSNAYCDAVATWPAGNVEFENQVLDLVNAHRAAGADCGSAGTFEPADPLTSAGDLRCAARNHSWDMATRGFFDHTNPDGDGPGERLDAAGFAGFGWGENIAWGQRTPQEVVTGWMNSDGHCRNIMNPDFSEIGVGYHESNYWTQTFGAR